MVESKENSPNNEVPKDNQIALVKKRPTRFERERQISTSITTLTIEQQNAIDLLITGISDREVAEKVGVARQTVTSWRLYHPQFIAELGRRREEVWGFSADRIRSLLRRAIEIVEQSLDNPENPDRLKLAVEILKQAGIFGALKSQQVTNAMGIIKKEIVPSGPTHLLDQTDQPSESDEKEAMERIYKKLEDSGGVRQKLKLDFSVTKRDERCCEAI